MGLKNTKDIEYLLPLNFDLKFRYAVQEEKSKMSKPISGQFGHLCFRIGPPKHKLGTRR